jgi:hypothetical protein
MDSELGAGSTGRSASVHPTVAQRVVALACTGATLAGAAGIALASADELREPGATFGAGVTLLLTVLWVGGVALVGLVLAFRRPDHAVSWLFVGLGPLIASFSGGWARLITPPAGWTYAFEWLSVVAAWLVVVLAGPGLALVFPDGHLPSARWRRPVAGLALTFTVSLGLLSVVPGSLGELGDQGRPAASDPAIGVAALAPLKDLLTLGLFVGVLGLGALGIAAIVSRRRHGDAVVRAQLAWFLLAAGLIPLGILVSMVESTARSDGSATIGPILLFLGFALTPVAVGIAILRYRLFDIDRVIRRTLAYGLVIAILGAVYTASIVFLQALVVRATDGQGLAVAGATLLVAAAFHPVRRPVQRAVDRRFYRTRIDGPELLGWLSLRVRDQLEVASISGDVAAIAHTAFQPRHVSVWLRPRAGRR